jgi:hypothetical protein
MMIPMLIFKEKQDFENFHREMQIEKQQDEFTTESNSCEILRNYILPKKLTSPDPKQFDHVTVLVGKISENSFELSTKDFVAALSDVFNLFDEQVENLSLEKVKSVGDKYIGRLFNHLTLIVAAGIMRENEVVNNVQRICDLAVRMNQIISQMNKKKLSGLQIQIGIHHSFVYGALMGQHSNIFF